MKRFLTLITLLFSLSIFAQSDEEKLYNNLLGQTPILEDLHELCDQIGGRVTGTEPNEQSVEWGITKFEKEGIKCWKEPFEMPRKWAEKSANAEITGEVEWSPKIACRAFSTGTNADGLSAELIFVGMGSDDEFDKMQESVRGNFVLVETPVMTDLTELFLEYINAIEIEANAKKYGAEGVVYMSSREKKLLYRHLTSYGYENDMPMIVMARDDATRCKRLLKRGKQLSLTLNLDLVDEGAYESYNVVAEIPGTDLASEIILIGAHLDSWGLGTGANDNGCNVNMMIDIARQIKKLELKPQRSIRFVLWNGEEQGMFGSYAYTQQHRDELDAIKMKLTIDIGSGKIDGFFVNGRKELGPMLNKWLEPIDTLGPFMNVPDVIVGTDNYDFFAQGVPNVVGKHKVYNYCSDYHSESDTYDKVNAQNLKENTAIVGWLTWKFANDSALNLKRHNRTEIDEIIKTYKLKKGMKALRLWDTWQDGTRGIK